MEMTFTKIQLQSVQIFFTNLCNLKCDMCDIWQLQDYGLSLDLIKNFLKQAKKLGAREAYFGGGEPLMRKDFLEIIKFAYRLGYFINFPTNGSLIDEEKAKVLSYYVDSISISVEGSKDNHDRVRGDGSYDKAILAIKLLKKYNVLLSLAMVISKYSYYYMKDLIDLADRLGVYHVTFHPVTKSNLLLRRDNWNRFVIPDEQIGDLTREIEETVSYARRKNITISHLNLIQRAPDFFRYNEKIYPQNGCLVPFRTTFLYPSGRICPCPQLSYFEIGNIKNMHLRDIWHSKNFEQARIMAKEGRCSGCLSCCTDQGIGYDYCNETGFRNKVKNYLYRSIKKRIEIFRSQGWRYVKRGLRRRLSSQGWRYVKRGLRRRLSKQIF